MPTKTITSIGVSPITRDPTWLSTLLSDSAGNTAIQIVSPKMFSTARVFANFARNCPEECLWRLAQNLEDVVVCGHPNLNLSAQRLMSFQCEPQLLLCGPRCAQEVHHVLEKRTFAALRYV